MNLNRSKGMKSVLFLMFSGIIINIVCAVITGTAGMPIFSDTVGTIMVSALLGYFPGVIVGFITNFLKSLINNTEFYYGSVNMIVAVAAAFMARKGYFERIHKAMIAALVIELASGPLASTITWLIDYSEAATVSMQSAQMQSFSSVPVSLVSQILKDLPAALIDKLVSTAIAYGLYTLIVKKGRGIMDVSGLRTAFEGYVKISAQKKERGKRSLRTKMTVILVIGSVIMSGTATFISYMMFSDSTINEHIKMADGITDIMVKVIDADRVSEYIEKGFEDEGYQIINDRLEDLRDGYPDVEFLYVYKIMEDGCHVVFDLDTESLPASKPGEIVDFDQSFVPYLDKLLNGEEVDPIISNDSFGHLLTVYKPVYDSNGQCQCYAAVDFSMNLLTIYGRVFMIKEITLFLGFFILILVLGLAFIEHNIVMPVNIMAYCAENFAFDSEEMRKENLERIRNVSIQTGDEIEHLHHAFIKTTQDVIEYMDNLKKARVLVDDMKEQVSVMDELAHKDSLTGIKNKAAYDDYMENIDRKIADGAMDAAGFAVIMADVNYLKKMNDNYGHERGNMYLINCVKLFGKIFGADRIYRIGGDEFVAVIEGEGVMSCGNLAAELRREIAKRGSDDLLDPWQRVSAAVGEAYYNPEKDRCAGDVFKRADKAMYANKLAMKAERRD